MEFFKILHLLICVVAISCGQILFKLAGVKIDKQGGWFSWDIGLTVGAAILLYGVTTLLWINLLRTLPLTKAYFFSTLSFVFVPIASHYIFSESLGGGVLIGMMLILCGIFVSVYYG